MTSRVAHHREVRDVASPAASSAGRGVSGKAASSGHESDRSMEGSLPPLKRSFRPEHRWIVIIRHQSVSQASMGFHPGLPGYRPVTHLPTASPSPPALGQGSFQSTAPLHPAWQAIQSRLTPPPATSIQEPTRDPGPRRWTPPRSLPKKKKKIEGGKQGPSPLFIKVGGGDEDAHLIDQAHPEEDAIQPSSQSRRTDFTPYPDLPAPRGPAGGRRSSPTMRGIPGALGQTIQVGWRRRL